MDHVLKCFAKVENNCKYLYFMNILWFELFVNFFVLEIGSSLIVPTLGT